MPPVTTFISFVNSRAFDGVPVFNLERAAQRGTDVHTAAALFLQGLWFEEDRFQGPPDAIVKIRGDVGLTLGSACPRLPGGESGPQKGCGPGSRWPGFFLCSGKFWRLAPGLEPVARLGSPRQRPQVKTHGSIFLD